jgi:phosphoribosyl-ATP pyrophosphohydrolase/phosphoribosyl-AMP cyclohydrolase/histidinol dehydrogenase
MSEPLLRRVALADLAAAVRQDPVDRETLEGAARIVEDVRLRGEAALIEHARRLGDLDQGGRLIYDGDDLRRALNLLTAAEHELLERTAERIRNFAAAQRAALSEITVPVPGGRAGHTVSAALRAGCYAPGGRFPLPSSVLMTAVTARAAAVSDVWVASPRPAPITLGAAAVAGADALLAAGGAQAVAALAFGAGTVPACDVVVGPGNRWVTAAKQLVSGRVRIDMLAGPSELVVLADATADAALVAADLLAQAEHDPDAIPALVTTSADLAATVDAELAAQLASLPTAENARRALANGFAVIVDSLDAGVDACDLLAPEHLEVMTADDAKLTVRLAHYGALFVGPRSAEVIGDYGAGPNHVLPTGRTARFSGGLSVFDFLRVRTWLELDDVPGARELARDAAALARLEGLEAHARAADRRS